MNPIDLFLQGLEEENDSQVYNTSAGESGPSSWVQ